MQAVHILHRRARKDEWTVRVASSPEEMVGLLGAGLARAERRISSRRGLYMSTSPPATKTCCESSSIIFSKNARSRVTLKSYQSSASMLKMMAEKYGIESSKLERLFEDLDLDPLPSTTGNRHSERDKIPIDRCSSSGMLFNEDA